MKAGGLGVAARINAIAEASGCRTQIGSMIEGEVGTAAGVHFALAFENVVWNEMVSPFMTTDGFTDLAVDEPAVTVDGPGLGVVVDQDALADLATDSVAIEQ